MLPSQKGSYPHPRWGVAIAGSAGAIPPLQTIVRSLSPSMDAAYLIAIHYPQDAVSRLSEILARQARVVVSRARDGEPLERGHVYVAPAHPNHLVIEDMTLRLVAPATRSRFSALPAANPIFESLAKAFGSRAIGVVLSGANENGAEGLRRIKEAGGFALVQSPLEASHRRMPEAALRAAKADWCGSAVELAALLRELCSGERQPAGLGEIPGRVAQPLEHTNGDT